MFCVQFGQFLLPIDYTTTTTMSDATKYTAKLQGTRVLVIGGTSGIGYATAEAVLEHGAAAVIVSSSNAQKVAAKVKELQSTYPSKAGRVSGLVCNLADQKTLDGNVKKLLEEATDRGQHKLDHVVHTAGDALAIQAIQDVELDALVQVGMVRFFSTVMLCKHAPGFMNAGPASSITLTTGQASERPNPGWSAVVGYAAGLHGLTRAMALDLAPLRVVLVSPGAVDTELWTTFGMSEQQRKDMLGKLSGLLPTGQVGKASDVAESYLYAMKDHNLTGALISTNGGALLKGPP